MSTTATVEATGDAATRAVFRVGPVAAMARRSIRSIVRQPQVWVPAIVFPMFFSAVSSAAFDRTRSLPGFPEVDSFLTFILPATIIQGVVFGATAVGTDMAIDMENGFADRLRVAPVGRIGLMLGRLAGVMVLAIVQTVVFSTVFVVAGASIAGGLASVFGLVLVSCLLAGAIGSFALIVALRTGSVEAVNGFFPILFAALFLSSAFFPPNLAGGWFEAVAEVNPVTWMINPSRRLVITEFSMSDLIQATAVSFGFMAMMTAGAVGALRGTAR
ncbi:MAG: ABC transporter permease [Actinomycetia bacterium]|nr:ABC transporter permease [Actinomycetes bacterium]MCP4961233.1 ABC transporter permease [Actinomycetes bacterium]